MSDLETINKIHKAMKQHDEETSRANQIATIKKQITQTQNKIQSLFRSNKITPGNGSEQWLNLYKTGQITKEDSALFLKAADTLNRLHRDLDRLNRPPEPGINIIGATRQPPQATNGTEGN